MLIPSEFATGPNPALAAWKTTTEDARPLECLEWGKGTPEDPRRLFVRVGEPEELHALQELEAGPGPNLRHPTLEELQAAIDHTAPAGSIFSLGMYTSRGQHAEEQELPEAAKYIGMALQQVGVEELTPAARSSLILN